MRDHVQLDACPPPSGFGFGCLDRSPEAFDGADGGSCLLLTDEGAREQSRFFEVGDGLLVVEARRLKSEDDYRRSETELRVPDQEGRRLRQPLASCHQLHVLLFDILRKIRIGHVDRAHSQRSRDAQPIPVLTGEGGKVLKAWSTGVDNAEGRDIVCTGQTAFSYLTGGPSLKSVDAVRPLLSYEDIFDLAWGLAVDFEFALLTGFAPRGTVGGSSFWDLATWDLSPWSLETTRQKLWRTPRVKPGYCYSLVLQVTSGLGSVSWSGHDFLINRGGALG